MDTSTLERFMSKVRPSLETGCWEWTAGKDVDGYGRFKYNGRTWAAHRIAYEIFVRPIPSGLVTDHECRNRGCVRPTHLKPVTNLENLHAPGSAASAARNKRKTECPRGHALRGTNLKPRQLEAGKRECLACGRAQSASYRARRRDRPFDVTAAADAYFTAIQAAGDFAQ